jgi:alpha-tubulin N-acetyltransferase 1
MLKVGKKHLFYRLTTGEIKELEPLCVLDFYVPEAV